MVHWIEPAPRCTAHLKALSLFFFNINRRGTLDPPLSIHTYSRSLSNSQTIFQLDMSANVG